MIGIFVGAAVVVLVIAVHVVRVYKRKIITENLRNESGGRLTSEVNLCLSVDDVLKLSGMTYLVHLENMMKESGIDTRIPVFYEKFQELSKVNKEKYLRTMLDILCQNRQDWLNDLLKECPKMVTNDILLLLLTEIGLDNKAIARILFTNVETLKKRKIRLKTKLIKIELKLDEA